MHGRTRIKTTKEKELEQKIKDREKAYHLKHLTEKIFELRKDVMKAQKLDVTLELASELLLINPDFYTVWNIRKEIIIALLDRLRASPTNKENEDGCQSEICENSPHSQVIDIDKNVKELLKGEMLFTIQCLKKNEKSYSVWQHRLWMLSKMPECEYINELALCTLFLEKDERNFHCWDYRNYISELAKANIKDEMDFTTEMIKRNFSNFSAWHRRHKLFLKGSRMPKELCPDNCDIEKCWLNEYQMVLEALFTDPSDQSPWKYHNFLVRNNYNLLNSQHLDTLKELAEMEANNNWVFKAISLVEDTIRNQC